VRRPFLDTFDGVETQKVLLGKGGYMWDRHTERPSNLVKVSDSLIGVQEPWKNIHNLDVYDVHGEQIGTLEDLYADRKQAHLPRFVGVAAGGLLGLGKKHFLIPVEDMSHDVGEDRVVVNHSRAKVMNSPEFDPDVVPKRDFQRAVYAYYGHS
jgi:sporulation protein YlmC with PRC-barrel domain